MKKLYTLFLMTLVSLVGFASVTVTVEVNDPELCTVVPYYYPGGTSGLDALEFDSSNQCEFTFPDGVYSAMSMLRATPVTPEGSETVYLKEYYVYDCDGEEVSSKTGMTNANRTDVKVPVSADGGRVVMVFGTLPAKHVTVTVEGDPAKIKFDMDGKVYSLAEGENALVLPANSKYGTISAVGVASFYSVKRNGETVERTAQGAEGVLSYYYKFNDPQDGETYEIITDYPDKDCEVTINCNDDDFIKEVYVNDERVYWYSYPQTVKAGDVVHIVGDGYNYTVDACGVGEDEWEYPSHEMTQLVVDDIEFNFTVTKIERSQQFVFYTPGGEWQLANTNSGQSLTLTEGYSVVKYEPEVDGSYYLSPVTPPADLNIETANIYLYINDEKQAEQFWYQFTPADGDVIKVYAAESAPTAHTVTYSLDGMSSMPIIIKDLYTEVSDNEHVALPGTQIKIMSNDDEPIGTVTVNGEEVYRSWSGSYMFTVQDDDCNVIISAPAARIITLKCNIPEGLYVCYADMNDFEASVEGTQYNLGDYDNSWGDYMSIYPNEGYTITSCLRNGEEILGSMDYDRGGNFFIEDLVDGDVFDVTLKEIVRDQQIMFYLSGKENTYGVILTEYSRNTSLTQNEDGLQDGYELINFATEDLPLFFQVFGYYEDGYRAYVYVNDEPVYSGVYAEIDCKDGDVVKVYIDNAEPEKYDVVYNLTGDGTVPAVTHDHIIEVGNPSNHSVLPGTHVKIASASETQAVKSVTVNDEAIEPDEDNNYSFAVNSHSVVEIEVSDYDAIKEVIVDGNANEGVYNLQGIRVNGNVENLPAGFYIVNGRKVRIN